MLIKQGFENKLTDKRCSKSCSKSQQKIVSPSQCAVWNSWRNDVKVKSWRGILWSSRVRGRVGTSLLDNVYQFLIAFLSFTKKKAPPGLRKVSTHEMKLLFIPLVAPRAVDLWLVLMMVGDETDQKEFLCKGCWSCLGQQIKSHISVSKRKLNLNIARDQKIIPTNRQEKPKYRTLFWLEAALSKSIKKCHP